MDAVRELRIDIDQKEAWLEHVGDRGVLNTVMTGFVVTQVRDDISLVDLVVHPDVDGAFRSNRSPIFRRRSPAAAR